MYDERHESADGRGDPDLWHSLTAEVGNLCSTAVRVAHVEGAAGLLSPGCTARELLYATDPLIARIDDIQATLGQGPCLDAYRHHAPRARIAVGNQHGESAWPLFDDAVYPLGVRAVFAYPLLLDGSAPLGVLEMYRRTAGPLDAFEDAAARLCAKTMSGMLALDGDPVDLMSELASSPGSRVPTAAGMVALQLNLLVDEALDVLRAHSYSHGRPLGDVADDVVQRRMTFTRWL